MSCGAVWACVLNNPRKHAPPTRITQQLASRFKQRGKRCVMSKKTVVNSLPSLLQKFYNEPFDIVTTRSILLHPSLHPHEGIKVVQYIKRNDFQSPGLFKQYLCGVARRGDKLELEKAISTIEAMGIKSTFGGWRDVYLQLHAARQEVDPLFEIFSSAIVENKAHLISRFDFEFCLLQLRGANKSVLEMFEVVWREMREAGTKPDLYIMNTFIQYYADMGNQTKVKKWIDEIKNENLQPNGFTYHYVILDAAKHEKYYRVERWLHRMKTERVKPEKLTFNMLIDLRAKKGDVEGAKLWIEEMKNMGLQPNIATYTSIISAALKRGDITSINEWLEDMKSAGLKPDLILFNMLADSAAKKGDTAMVQQWMERMKAAGVRPDAATFGSLMYGSKEGVQYWLERMRKAGVEPSVWTFNAWIRDAVKEPDSANKVNELLELMARRRVTPDVVTFFDLVKVAVTKGDSATVKFWFDKMRALGVPELAMHKSLAQLSQKVGKIKWD